jgi:carbamate kinase
MDEEMADRRRQQGWDLIEDSNRGWRRVVASPTPIRIVEMAAIRSLVDAGVVVITAGGGGIPVVADAEGNLQGVPAVIDKDLATALLATELGADLMVISTAIEQVALDFGKPEQRFVDRMTASEARGYLEAGTHFAAGSMAPKVQAVLNYLDHGGKEAIVTDPANVERALKGETGTHFVPD